MKTHEQYFVGVIKKYQQKEYEADGKYYNAICWYPARKGNARYVGTLEEAKKVLDHAYKMWNGVHVYNEKGERYETNEAAPGIGVTMVLTKELDDRQRIVKHVIQKRLVTDWETIDWETAEDR